MNLNDIASYTSPASGRAFLHLPVKVKGMVFMKSKEKEEQKNGCFGCLGCLGIIFIIMIIFGACGAIFGDEEASAPEEEIVQGEPEAVETDEEQKEQSAAALVEKEKQEKEAEAKEKAEAEKKEKEEAERIAKEEAEKEEAQKEALANSDKECGDFSTTEEVLVFWYENSYSAENDPHDLDVDNDGLPCEASQSEYDSANGDSSSTTDSSDVTEDAPTSTPSSSIYYDNCTAVRDAGADPIRVGDPGYGTHLDRDEDGIGCE